VVNVSNETSDTTKENYDNSCLREDRDDDDGASLRLNVTALPATIGYFHGDMAADSGASYSLGILWDLRDDVQVS
jgi:hypothetical protein